MLPKDKECPFCHKFYSTAGIGTHIWRNHGEGKQHDPNINYKNGRIVWNKNLTKETNESVKSMAEKQKALVRPKKSEETRKKISIAAKARGFGGYRPHPNRGERYKGIWFDSKWEVKVAKSLDENQIRWERPKIGFVWSDAGNKYYPDFYLIDYDVYLDPKNSYLMIKDAEKIHESQKRNNIKVLVLTEHFLNWEKIKLLL
jgi:hypothetical protein